MTNNKTINLENILLNLKIGNEEFLEFLCGKVKVLPLKTHEFGWGCFPFLDDNSNLIDIKLLVPQIIDEATLLVNIHEYAHAFELYQQLGLKYEENIEASEQFAKNKEKEYLKIRKFR